MILIGEYAGQPWLVGLGIGAALTLTAVILVWLITRKLHRPLQELVSLNRVADGHYDEHFDQSGQHELAHCTQHLTISPHH